VSDICGEWQLNKILYADGTALVADESVSCRGWSVNLGECARGANCL
jgi:hypothetical protein